VNRALQRAVIAPALVILAACAGRSDPRESEPTAGGERAAAARQHEPGHDAHGAAAHPHAHHADHGLPATAGPGYTVADVRFMQEMIAHHAQALRMSELAPARAGSDRLLKLAEKIDISQRDEILMMRQWLRERGRLVPADEHVHSMHMPGMATEAQLQALAAARGPAFDRLFLELMIRHHEGALVMVDALFASPGAAQDSDIFRFVTDVAADQADEIFVMEYLLDTLAKTGGADT
jgi:uncharacterized protein (DUF305 family)